MGNFLEFAENFEGTTEKNAAQTDIRINYLENGFEIVSLSSGAVAALFFIAQWQHFLLIKTSE